MKGLFIALLLLAAPVAAQDAIPPDQVTFVGPGAESGAFPIATTITRVTFNASGMEVEFSKKDGPERWPSGRTPGWDGDLQYSVGWVVRANDWWYASAPIENWYGRKNATGPLQDQTVTDPKNPRCMGQFQCNIFYDQRWDPLQTRRPSPGETIGVYVVSGDVRSDVFYGVRERSNIVLVQLPGQGQTAAFDFTGATDPTPPVTPPVVLAPPIVTPPPPVVTLPPPIVTPPLDFDAAIRRVLNEELLPLERDTNAKTTAIYTEVRSFAQQFGSVMAFVGKWASGPTAAALITYWMTRTTPQPAAAGTR